MASVSNSLILVEFKGLEVRGKWKDALLPQSFIFSPSLENECLTFGLYHNIRVEPHTKSEWV